MGGVGLARGPLATLRFPEPADQWGEGGGGQQGSQAGQPAGGDSNAGEKGGGGAMTSESGDGSDETHGKHSTVYELVQQADCFKIWIPELGLRQLFNTATIRIKFL